MKRRALLVGINSARAGVYAAAPLRGCLADVAGYRALLERRGWADGEVVTLADERATAAAIRHELGHLRSVARDGGTVLLAYSGHGAEDGSAGVLCPVDFDWTPATEVTPDDLHDAFGEADGARCTVILDSCHSGWLDGVRGLSRMSATGRDVRARGLGRRAGAAAAAHVRALASTLPVPVLAACGPAQTAADAVIAGRPAGAFSYYLQAALRRAAVAGSPIDDVVALVATSLRRMGYEQRPEASGPCGRALFEVAS